MESHSTITYGPALRKQAAMAALLAGLGGLALASQITRKTAAGIPGALSVSPVVLLGAVALLSMAALLIVGVIRGTPKLTITPLGITLRRALGTRFVPWDRLGTFTITNYHSALRKPRVIAATAVVSGETKRRLRTLMLPNTFEVPVASVVAGIESARPDRQSSVAPAMPKPERMIGNPGFRYPWLTVTMVISFAVAFWLEHELAVTPNSAFLVPSVQTLLAMGGVNLSLVASGQLYRVFTAPFLHAGLAHLLCNAVVFSIAGYSLERLIGRAWTFLAFGLGAVCGSIMSMALSSPSTVSVGASGGIMAMLITLFTVSFRLSAGRLKSVTQATSARLAIPALIPFGSAAAITHIDYGAHLGGALFGVATGLFLVKTWRDDSPTPAFPRLANVTALVSLACFITAGAAASAWYIRHAGSHQGNMQAMVSSGEPNEVVSLDDIVRLRPSDPVAHLNRARRMLTTGDMAGAEAEVRTSLSLTESEGNRAKPGMLANVRGVLAIVLLAGGKQTEARSTAQSVCSATGDAAPAPKIASTLADAGLCSHKPA